MKKIIAIILCCLFMFSLTACSEPVSENISIGAFINIGGDLVYDSVTKIVYIDNYTSYNYSVYVPYYAPNGLPYKYNTETNTLEEIIK